MIEPETVVALTVARPDEARLTLPLTECTWTVPAEPFTLIEPDVVDTSSSPVAPTAMRPLVVEIRHGPSHSSSSTAPETVRRSASDTLATRIDPLSDVTATAPNLPLSSTLPDWVPTITSAPTGHLTATSSDPRRGPTSTDPSSAVAATPPRSTPTSERDSAMTLTRPENAPTRTRSGAGIRSAMPTIVARRPAPNAGRGVSGGQHRPATRRRSRDYPTGCPVALRVDTPSPAEIVRGLAVAVGCSSACGAHSVNSDGTARAAGTLAALL